MVGMQPGTPLTEISSAINDASDPADPENLHTSTGDVQRMFRDLSTATSATRYSHAMDDPAQALKGLRDSLRSGISDADEYTFQLSSTLDSIGLGPMSVPSSNNENAIQRYLPSVQQGLLSTLPTFLPALDGRGRKLLDTFFCPPPSAPTAATARQVALAAYLTLTAALAPAPPTPLPTEARELVLEMLADLAQTYGIDALYWATQGKKTSPLLWEDAVRTSTSLPAKAANAVGRWKEGAWSGDVPPALVPRAYFDNYVRRFEGLLYEASQNSLDLGSLRDVLEKLGRLGLFAITPATEIDTPTPSFFPAFLPQALEHLHPPPGSPLPPYPGAFFPDLLLPLSDTNLKAFIAGLLVHLALRISPPFAADVEADKPSGSVKRAAIVMAQFLGKPVTTSEAWHAVIDTLLGKSLSLEGTMETTRRIATAWVGSGNVPTKRAFLDAVLEAWSDPKHIKYASYAVQYSKSHVWTFQLTRRLHKPRYSGAIPPTSDGLACHRPVAPRAIHTGDSGVPFPSRAENQATWHADRRDHERAHD